MIKSSAREANFACKQQSNYGEEDGENKQHVRGADHCVVGQLVGLTSHFIDIEAYWKDERRHAEQDHWKETEREKMLVRMIIIKSLDLYKSSDDSGNCPVTEKQSVTIFLFPLKTEA